MVVVKRTDEYLEHHGILKQKWGVRHGPPYPLNYDDHSQAQKNANPKSELNNYENNNPIKKNSSNEDRPKKDRNDSQAKTIGSAYHSYKKGNHDLKSNLGLSDEEAEKLKKRLKIAGIALGTTAAVVAAGYYYQHYADAQKLIEQGYNDDGSRVRYALGSGLFNNKANGDYVGDIARLRGYDAVSSDQLPNALAHPDSKATIDYDDLVYEVRQNQISGSGDRRLSCWSASNAYFMTAMTGHEYASKSFTNLVDFNDFGKLYTEKPEIYNAFGRHASNFVGGFGGYGLRGGSMATDAVSKSLVKNIFKNISEGNNLSADGSRTIGFINAGYHSTTCTHQFNFEMIHGANGFKELFIADGYTGDRYKVASLNAAGKIKYMADGMSDLASELHHYNADSIRFYAPSTTTINTDMMANVIIGKK